MSDDIKYTIIEVKHEDIPDEVRAILDSDDDGDICSCGHDWSSDISTTPIPEDEVPEYLTRLGEWDISKITNVGDMFADTKFINCMPKSHEWDVSNMTNVENMLIDSTKTSPHEFKFGENTSLTLETDQAHIEDVADCSLVLIKRGNKFLGVSRKHDHNDIGLPGGKRERDESFEDCARREATEETDFIIKLLPNEPFEGVDMGLYCQTFLAEIVGKVTQVRDPSETGIVDWFDKQVFIDGSFGEYNTLMFKHFGIN